MDLIKRSELSKGVLVTQGHVDDTVVGKSGNGVEGSHLLATAGGTSRDKETSVLAVEGTLGPETASRVPESLPLSREVTVTGGNSKEETIVLSQGAGRGNGVIGLGRSVHLAQDLLREGLGDLEDVSGATSSLDTGLDRLGDSADVAVGGVVDNSDLGSHCEYA